MSADAPSIHASAVLVGAEAVLIRGPSGSGKSRLAFDLILAGRAGQIAPVLLIGDDRVVLSEQGSRLIVQPVSVLAGMIEIRGLGIRRCGHARSGPVGLVVDLMAPDAARLPETLALATQIGPFMLPRVPVGADFAALPLVLAALTTAEAATDSLSQADCRQGIGNHMRPTLAPS